MLPSLIGSLLPLLFAAPVPVGGAEEAAGSGHRPHHPAGQQLVSHQAVAGIYGKADRRPHPHAEPNERGAGEFLRGFFVSTLRRTEVLS